MNINDIFSSFPFGISAERILSLTYEAKSYGLLTHFVLVSPEFVLVSPKQSDRKGNNKDSKCKLKKYLFGN